MQVGAQNPLPVKRNFTIKKGRKKKKKSNNVLDATVAVMNVDHIYSLSYFTFTKVTYFTFPTTNLFSLYVVYSKRGSMGNLAKLSGHVYRISHSLQWEYKTYKLKSLLFDKRCRTIISNLHFFNSTNMLHCNVFITSFCKN